MSKTVALIVTAEVTALTFYRGYPRFLKEHGWEVVIIAKSEGHLEPWALDEGATAHSIEFVREPSPVSDLKALVSTFRLLRKLRPDVVVSATPKAGLLGTVAAWLAGAPVRIYQLWGLRLETEMGPKRRVLEFLERVAIGLATQCVANSHSLAKVTEDLGLARKGSIAVLGAGSSHGVDIAHFSPSVNPPLDPKTRSFLAAAEADLTVAFVGRLTPDKGIDTLLRAMEICGARGSRVRAIVVGPVENHETKRGVERWSSAEVHLTGQVVDVRPYIIAADVLCLPSLREGFPNVVLEAAALGTPAVVSSATGAIDSVVDGVTGRIFRVGDSAALAECLLELSKSHDHLQELGRAARERVEQQFEKSLIWRMQLANLEKGRMARGGDE